MSKAKIEKSAVIDAVAKLKAAGRDYQSITVVRAACGNIGSFSTYQRLLAEIAAEALAAKGSPQATKSFGAIWTEAVEEGRNQRTDEIRLLQETVDALEAQVDTLEGEATANKTLAEEATTKHEGAVAKMTTINDELARATAVSESRATELLETIKKHNADDKKLREDHQREINLLRTQLEEAKSREHSVEVELAVAKARLDIADKLKSPQA
jgi:chromosome segregation ATPase